MTNNEKAASSHKAATLEKTASIPTVKNNNFHLFKQQIKKIIVMSALWGLIPAWLGCWLIGRGGEHGD
jgi:hypothetical protein